MIKKLLFGILLIAAIAAAVIFFLPIIQEQLAYNKVKSEESIESCKSYEEEWPEGKHLKEVNAIWDRIWDKEIKKYEDNDKSQASAEGIKMMRELLQYMKQQRINTLLLTTGQMLDIKDFDEYDVDIQLLMERTNETSLPYKEGIVTVKSNFDDKYLEAISNLLVTELQQHLDQVFSPKFIQVVATEKPKENTPTIGINYTIANKEITINNKAYPQIWSYPPTEDDEEEEIPDGFLMGLNTSMSFGFIVPKSLNAYIHEENGEITDYLKQVKNLNEGYKEMTSLFFQERIGKIAKEVGL